MQTSFDDPDFIHAYTYEQNLYFVCAPRWKKTLLYMLHAMTKPAIMTFSCIVAIKFYFNANLTNCSMVSYWFNISLT